MGTRIELIITLVAFLSAAVLLFGCKSREETGDDDRPDGDFESPYTGQELADKIQAAIDSESAYTIAVQQMNFVLPQWGGSDGGSVTVGGRDGEITALASLGRTGDGAYVIVLRDGQTYFKRSTCNDLARVPGGGGDVLEPFIFLGNDRIKNAKNLKAASGRTSLLLTLEGIGDAEISFSPQTFLPNQLSSRTATNNGTPLVWTFTGWDQPPEIGLSPAEFANAYERGPGGNPC